MSWRPCVLMIAITLITGCASANTSAASISNTDAEYVVPRRDILLAADLVAARSDNVYEAILEVRPAFLRRQISSLDGGEQPLRVFVDNLELSGLDALRAVPLGPVTSVRYMDPADASFRWGPGRSTGPTGAIVVTTTR